MAEPGKFGPDLRGLEQGAYQAAGAARGFVGEFREFIRRGNMIDLAVGVIVGGAFGKVVSSLVGDIIMPPIGLLLGGVRFTDLKLVIGGTPEAPVTVNYGNFLQAGVDFLIIALCVFLIVKAINALKRPLEGPPKPPEPTPQEKLLAEIRDLLKAKAGGGPTTV